MIYETFPSRNFLRIRYEVGDIEHEINESKAVTAKIMDCQQRIHKAIKKPTNSPVVPLVTPVPTSVLTKPKLPKLTLPRFKGELTMWITFWANPLYMRIQACQDR